MKNYRPVTLLNCFSSIYEKFLNEQLLHFAKHSLSLISSLLVEEGGGGCGAIRRVPTSIS